jgi:hypothetical protein
LKADGLNLKILIPKEISAYPRLTPLVLKGTFRPPSIVPDRRGLKAALGRYLFL